MPKRAVPAGQDRAAALDAAVRELLAAWNARGARHAARHEFDREMAALYRTDPAKAVLIDAGLAGQYARSAATLKNCQPPEVPGYTGGPPSAAHLIAAYTSSRTEAQGRRAR